MKKLILVVLALASVAFYSLPGVDPEPVHRGRPLRAWLFELQASTEDMRAEAALALCRTQTPAGSHQATVTQALIGALADRSLRVQQIALVGLFRLALDNRHQVRPAMPALERILIGDDAVNRSHAAQLLGMLGADPKKVVPLLTKALADPSPLVRTAAARGLGEIGRAARLAAPALVDALHDSDKLVQLNAGWALKVIDPEAAARASERGALR